MPIIQTQNGYIYKKNKKNTRSKSKFFLVLFLICIVIVVATLYLFSKYNLTSALKLNKYLIFEGQTYYFVSVESGDTFRDVSSNSTEIKLQDGAGYVYFKDGKYYLIASAYKSLDDAKSVARTISAYNCQVVEIKLDKLILSADYSQEQLNALKYSINLINRFFDKVYEILISYDRGEILDAEVRQKLQIYQENCQQDKETFAKAFQSSSENIVTYVKIFQSEVISNLSAMIISQNLSSDIKYMIVSTLTSFETLQKNIKK